jgi:ABC-type oligopeptide transport system substrate-binding subunit/DNA-binding SARP family transcriptional activator
MSQLALHLLGPPRLELDGEPLDINRRKAIALMAYLAVGGRAQSRDALATLLWPGYDHARARAALRRTLSTLNRALGKAWLETGREMIAVDQETGFWLDVAEFRARLAAFQAHGHAGTEVCPDCLLLLQEAADLYRDEFMAGFSLRDSSEFDDWQFFQSENLRRDLAGALERLIPGYCARDEYELALGHARRWLSLDPLHEAAHQRLMQLYAWTEQRPAALRQYQECARILQEELGISPSEETAMLYKRIRAGHMSRKTDKTFPGSPLPARQMDTGQPGLRKPDELSKPPVLSSPPDFLTLTRVPEPSDTPFVARKEELAYLAGCLGKALVGQGRVTFVAGEAGSGKTALVREFARRAQEATPDLLVAMGTCNAYTGLGDPYLPFREILGLLSGDIEVKWTQRVITEENARRLWAAFPYVLQSLSEVGPDLIDSFIAANALVRQAAALGPGWAEGLRSLLEGRSTSDISQSDLFEQYIRLLRLVAAQAPLLLVVDDAQWADAASTSLLFHLGRQLEGNRILLVITYRPDEVALGRQPTLPAATLRAAGTGQMSTRSASRDRHPLEPVINELKRTYGDVEIELSATMGRHFVDALLDTKANRLGDTFRAALYNQTEGHPLFTVELLRAMQERRDLVTDPEGRWVEGLTLDWNTLPARVEAVIEERVGRLDAGLRDILAVASVEGETFTAQVIARVQGIGERHLLQSLSQDLQRRHHLVQAKDEIQVDHQFLSRYRFTHTMFQHYLYNACSPGERRLLHGEIAAVLEDIYREQGEEISVQLARHYSAAGQAEQAVAYLLRAGDRARDLYAHQEAINYYERALALLKQEGNYERAARTLMKLGLTHHLAFDFPQARQVYQEGFSLWQQACADQPTPRPPAPHPLRMAWFEVPSLNYSVEVTHGSGVLISQLFSGLVALNADLDVVPEAAQSWEVLKGGKEYVFHLRDDICWSDGRPVTAQDFVYAWQLILNPAQGSTNVTYLLDIKGALAYHQGQVSNPDHVGVRAPDNLTLLVELEGPTSYFPQLLAQPALCPVPQHIVEAHGSAWTRMEHLVTNGPFKLERWRPGDSMLLVRNPDYRGQFTGNVEQVALTLGVTSPVEQLIMYEANELDLVFLSPSPEANRMRQRHAEEYISAPALFTQSIAFNVQRPPFNDRRVRQALAMAVDKEHLASVVLSGYHFPAAGGFIPSGMPAHSPGISLLYNPERARTLLAEAGYPAGSNFPVVEGMGRDPASEAQCDYLQAQWRENLGIDIEWQPFADWRSIIDRLQQEPPDLLWIGWYVDYLDPDNPLRVGTHRIWPTWQNQVYMGLVEQARRNTNQAERLTLYQQADRILIEEAAIVPTYYGRQHLLVKPWVRRFPVSATTYWPFWKDVIIGPHA